MSSRPRPASSCSTRHRDRRGRRADLRGRLRSCADHDLPHEAIDGRETRTRFPGVPPAGRAARRLPAGRRLPAPGAVRSSRTPRARLHGAPRVRARERVLDWEDDRERGARPHGSGDRRGRASRADRRCLVAGGRTAAAPGLVGAVRQVPRLAPAHAAGDLRARRSSPCSTSSSTASHFYGFPDVRDPGVQGRPLRPRRLRAATRTPSRASRPSRTRPAPRVRRALLPGRRRPGARASRPASSSPRRTSTSSSTSIRSRPPRSSAPASRATASSSARSSARSSPTSRSRASTRQDIGLFRLDRFDARVEGQDLVHDSRYR